MRACHIVVTGVFILLLPAAVFTQPLKRLNSLSYNINEGLLHSHIREIAEDGMGFIWMSSGAGVQRFDGKNFHTVRLTNGAQGIPDDKSVSFLKRANGNLLLTHQKGIDEYQVSSNRFRPLYRSQGRSRLLPAYETGAGIWCWSPGKGLFLIDDHSGEYRDSLPYPTGYRGNSFKPVLCGDKLVLHFEAGFQLVVDLARRSVKEIRPPAQQRFIFDIAPYHGDTVLVATIRGIETVVLRNQSFNFVCAYPVALATNDPLLPLRILPVKPGIYLISTGTSLFELDTRQRQFVSRLVNLQNEYFFQPGYATNMMLDRYKNIWLLSQNDGVKKINYESPPFRYYGTTDRRNNFARSILVSKKDNRALCGTFGRGIHIFDTAQHLLKHVPALPGITNGTTVCGIARLSTQQYMLITQQTWDVFLMNTVDFSVRKIKTKLVGMMDDHLPDYHLTILPENDTSFIVQSGYYIFRMSVGRDGALVRTLQKLPTPSISSYRSGNLLWVGSDGWFYRYDLTKGKLENFALPEKLLVTCFLDDGDRVWLATARGLYQVSRQGTILRRYDRSAGLADDHIYALKKDREGQLWMSHNKGISCLRADGNLLHFSSKDGLQENEFNTGASFETGDGELFFGGVNGISSFFPWQLQPSQERRDVMLTNIRLKDREWKKDTAYWNLEKITLPHHENSISFEFTAMGSRAAEQYNYQYKMEGVDEDWINAGNNPRIHYVLSPGSYTLLYHASSAFEKNPASPKQLLITVKPPFWRTLPFVLFSALSLTGLVVFITRYISRRKLKKRIMELERKRALDNERLRISREMHDDIGAGLTQIALLSEAAKLKAENTIQLNEIGRTSRKLVENMNEIIWSLHPDNNSLADLLSYLREQLARLLEYSSLDFTIEFPQEGKTILLNNGQRRNLLLVSKELVHNAIKHSQAKQIHISCKIDKEKILFTVRDDGTGFNQKSSFAGNGLKNIRKRMEMIDGFLEMESGTSGTIVKYGLSLDNS